MAPLHKPGINPVMTRYLGCLGEWGSRVKGRGQQRALGELRAVALCQAGQTYFNILTASKLVAICVAEAQTHTSISGCSPKKRSPPIKERKVEGWRVSRAWCHAL